MSTSSLIVRSVTNVDSAGFATTIFLTELGWMGLAWRESTVVGLVFGHPSQDTARSALRRLLRLSEPRPFVVGRGNKVTTTRTVEQLVDRLCLFTAGEPVDFADVSIDTEHLTPFARRVTAACRRLGWGETCTYGQLAAACGSPDAARAVGQVMAANRYPLIVPCHRVLAAGGRLGGYSAPQGLAMKRRLLAMEQHALR